MNEGDSSRVPPVRRAVKAGKGPQPTLLCSWVLIPFLVRGSTNKTTLEGKTLQIYKEGIGALPMRGVIGMTGRSIRGQGALEYLLLIGGAVLVGTVVLLIAIGSTSSTTGIINDNLDTFSNELSIHAAFGGGGSGPGPTCDNDGTCDAGEDNSNCPADCPPGVDNNPPSISFSVADAATGGVATVTYSATDPSPPVFAGIVYDTVQSNITGLNESTFPLHPSLIVLSGSPQNVVGLTDGLTYYFRMEACDGATPTINCVLSNTVSVTPTSGGGPVSFSGFTVSAPSPPSAGSVDYDFDWAVGSACAAGTGVNDSAILLSAGLISGGTVPKNVMDAVNFNISDDDAPGIYQFVASSGSSTGLAPNNALKLAAANGETNPSFGIFCEDAGGSNYELQSAVITSTFPLDSDVPVTPSAPVVTPGSTNGGVLNFSATTTADQYLGAVLSNPALNHTDVQVACDTTLMNTPALVDAAIAAGKTIGYTNQSSGVLLNSSLNYTQNIVPSLTYRCAMRSCDIVDGVITNTANCSYSTSTATVVSSKEAQLWETNLASGSYGSSVNTAGTHLGESVIQLVTSGCSTTQVFADYPVTFLAPASPNATYTIWVRGANVNTSGVNRQNVTVGIGAASSAIQFSGAGASAPLVWNKTTVLPSTVSWSGGPQTVKLEFTAGGPASCTQTDLRIDKVVVTTESGCNPNTDVTPPLNCQ